MIQKMKHFINKSTSINNQQIQTITELKPRRAKVKHDIITRAKLRASGCAGHSLRLKSGNAGRFTGCRRKRPARSRWWRCRESRRKLIFIRGIPVEVVGHEEDVRSSGDQSVARFHHLKAQKAERTHQFHCGQRKDTSERHTDVNHGSGRIRFTYHDRPCSYKSRQTRWALSDVLQQTPAETRSWNHRRQTSSNYMWHLLWYILNV